MYPYLVSFTTLILACLSSAQDIPNKAGIGEAIYDYFDGGETGFDRYHQVKNRYSDIEVWDKLEQVSTSYHFAYDTLQLPINYENWVVADEYDGLYPQHSLSIEYQPPGQETYLSKYIYKANVWVFPGSGDTELLNRPLVIGDAFDPIGARQIIDIQNQSRYQALLKIDSTDDITTPREMGYDVVFVDFSQGGGRIDFNAKLFARVLGRIQKKSEGSLVVSGISMSGLVARTALMMGEAQNTASGRALFPDVKGWLSIDSPQEGAVIGALQKSIWSMMTNENVEFGLDLSDANSNLGTTFLQLNVPASHQMLRHHFYRGSNFQTVGYDAFQEGLKMLGGFPKIYSEAIAYSSWYLPNKEMPSNDVHTAKVVKIEDIGYSYDLKAGGDQGGMGEGDYEPGSSGNWYFEVFEGTQSSFMHESSLNPGGENFAGTFIPIRSALALGDIPWKKYAQEIAAGKARREVSQDSRFDRVDWMDGINQYPVEFGRNYPTHYKMRNRFEHMVFDKKMMSKIELSLNRIQWQGIKTAVLGIY